LAAATLRAFSPRIARRIVPETLTDQSDGDFVECSLSEPNEALFEARVRRHRPLIDRTAGQETSP
jgi:hypothetical protein